MRRKIFWPLLGVMAGLLATAVCMLFIFGDLTVGEGKFMITSYVFFITLGVATVFGVILLILTARGITRAGLKRFLLLTEASLFAFPVFAMLHNAIGALLNIEEAVFFILATIICPLGFLVGATGSIVLLLKQSGKGKKSTPELP